VASTSLAEHRRRLKERGLVRLEVRVRQTDVPLVREVAAALGDPSRAAAARQFLQRRFAPAPAEDLKALLAEAPLDDVDLERARDVGRAIDP